MLSPCKPRRRHKSCFMKYRKCCNCDRKAVECCCHCCKEGGPGGGGNNGPPGWQPQPVGTWLLIRYDDADTGARPVPSGDVWWASPDIWITGGDEYGNPIGGQPAVIHARVWNLGGVVAMPVAVTFSFIEPGLGLPTTAPTPIPGTVGANVQPKNYQEVTMPWTPPTVIGDVHTCIIVTCSCLVSNDVPSVPGSVVADRHTGQRNLTIIGTPVGKFEFGLTMTNLRPYAAAVQLGVRALWRTDAGFNATAAMDVPALKTAALAIDIPHTQRDYRLLAKRAALLSVQTTHRQFTLISQKGLHDLIRVTHVEPGHVYRSGAFVPPVNRVNATLDSITPIGRAVELKALQRASVHFAVTVPDTEHEREWLVVHITQITEGAVEGGYTLALRVGRPEVVGKMEKHAHPPEAARKRKKK
jgi:hypothetical protein